MMKLLRRIFWSKQLKWLRKLFGADKPNIDPTKIEFEEDQFQSRFRAFSGVDIKVYFQSEDNRWCYSPEVQAVSCVGKGVPHEPQSAKGSIVSLVFDRDPIESLPFLPKNMLLEACNEYGEIAYAKFYGLRYPEHRWAVSVDDLVMERVTDFTADKYIPWTNKKVSANYVIDERRITDRLDSHI